MTTPGSSIAAALTPVREALLDQARRDAAAVVADADRDARQILATAQAAAETVLAKARTRGQHDADAALGVARARSRRDARAAELTAQREAYQRLRHAVTARVRQLRDAPEYPALRKQLTAWVRAALGDEAVITEATCGGVIGRTPHRVVDCSLDAVANWAVSLLGAEVEGLWQQDGSGE